MSANSRLDWRPDGAPRLAAVSSWLSLAFDETLPEVQRKSLACSILRFTRSDGSAMFHPSSISDSADRWSDIQKLAAQLQDRELRAITRDWKRWDWSLGVPPELRTDLVGQPVSPQPLSIYRHGTAATACWMALDHRDPGAPAQFELAGAGQIWLGSHWGRSLPPKAKQPKVVEQGRYWIEWQFPSTVRTLVCLAEEQLAIIAEQTSNSGSAEIRLGLPPGVMASLDPQRRIIRLTSSESHGRSAVIVPLGLPALPYSTSQGSLTIEGEGDHREVVLRQTHDGRRHWLPLVVCWDQAKIQEPLFWRTLTVSEKSRIRASDVAFGARFSWGEQTYLIYRSLVAPELRAVLGSQIRERNRIARLMKDGSTSILWKMGNITSS